MYDILKPKVLFKQSMIHRALASYSLTSKVSYRRDQILPNRPRMVGLGSAIQNRQLAAIL